MIKITKASVHNKRSILETMDINVEQIAKKNKKIIQPKQIIDLEDEGPRDQVNLNNVESGTSIVEIEERSQLESEVISRVFHTQKYYFDKVLDATCLSIEDLAKTYAEKINVALVEMKDLFCEVEKITQHKYSLFTVRYTEK